MKHLRRTCIWLVCALFSTHTAFAGSSYLGHDRSRTLDEAIEAIDDKINNLEPTFDRLFYQPIQDTHSLANLSEARALLTSGKTETFICSSDHSIEVAYITDEGDYD